MGLFQLAKRKSYGSLTQVADTIITRLIDPHRGCFTTVADVWYTASTTAHTLTVMRPLGFTTVSSAAAAAQAVINITADPGVYSHFGTIDVADNAIAANDFVCYQTADGTYTFDKVASVSGLAITMTNNVPTSTVLKGAPFWFFGIITDLNPADGLAHPKFTLAASGTTKLGTDPGDTLGGIVSSIAPPAAMRAMTSSTYGQWPLNGQWEPLVLHSGNATAAGTLEKTTAIYTMLA